MVDSPGQFSVIFLTMENGHVEKTLEKFPRAREGAAYLRFVTYRNDCIS